MWIVILEQYELSTDKLPTKVPLKIQPVPLERGNKQLNLTNPNFFKEKPLGNCSLFSDTCHYEKQTTKMFKNGMYVKKKVNLMSHESSRGSVNRGAPAKCSERYIVRILSVT